MLKSLRLKRRRSLNKINMKAMKNKIMNEMQRILYLFTFLECSRNSTVPGKGYILSQSNPTGVTDTSTASQSAPHSKKAIIIVTAKYLRNLPEQCESSS